MHVPVVLSIDEVRMVLAQLTDAPWIVVALLYGAGLRLQECLELRVKDVDFDRHEIVVQHSGERQRACYAKSSNQVQGRSQGRAAVRGTDPLTNYV